METAANQTNQYQYKSDLPIQFTITPDEKIKTGYPLPSEAEDPGFYIAIITLVMAKLNFQLRQLIKKTGPKKVLDYQDVMDKGINEDVAIQAEAQQLEGVLHFMHHMLMPFVRQFKSIRRSAAYTSPEGPPLQPPGSGTAPSQPNKIVSW